MAGKASDVRAKYIVSKLCTRTAQCLVAGSACAIDIVVVELAGAHTPQVDPELGGIARQTAKSIAGRAAGPTGITPD